MFFIILGTSINNCSSDADARFQLAITANDLVLAYQIALEAQNIEKWKQLRELARANSNFEANYQINKLNLFKLYLILHIDLFTNLLQHRIECFRAYF